MSLLSLLLLRLVVSGGTLVAATTTTTTVAATTKESFFLKHGGSSSNNGNLLPVCRVTPLQPKKVEKACEWEWNVESFQLFREAHMTESTVLGGLVAVPPKEKKDNDVANVVSFLAVTQDANAPRMYTLEMKFLSPKKKKKKKKKQNDEACASVQVVDVCFFSDNLRIQQVRGITTTTTTTTRLENDKDTKESPLWLLYDESVLSASAEGTFRPVIRRIQRNCQVVVDDDNDKDKDKDTDNVPTRLEIPRKFGSLGGGGGGGGGGQEQPPPPPRNQPFVGKGLNSLTSDGSFVWSAAQQALQGDARAFADANRRLARSVAWNFTTASRGGNNALVPPPVAEFVNRLDLGFEWIDVVLYDEATPWNLWSLEEEEQQQQQRQQRQRQDDSRQSLAGVPPTKVEDDDDDDDDDYTRTRLYQLSFWAATNVLDQEVLSRETFDPRRHAARKFLLWEVGPPPPPPPRLQEANLPPDTAPTTPRHLGNDTNSSTIRNTAKTASAAAAAAAGSGSSFLAKEKEEEEEEEEEAPSSITDFTLKTNVTTTPPPSPLVLAPTFRRRVQAMALLPSFSKKKKELVVIFRPSAASPLPSLPSKGWTLIQLSVSTKSLSSLGLQLIQYILDDIQDYFPPGNATVAHHRKALRRPAKKMQKKHLPKERCNPTLSACQGMMDYMDYCSNSVSFLLLEWGACMGLLDWIQQLVSWTQSCLCD